MSEPRFNMRDHLGTATLLLLALSVVIGVSLLVLTNMTVVIEVDMPSTLQVDIDETTQRVDKSPSPKATPTATLWGPADG